MDRKWGLASALVGVAALLALVPSPEPIAEARGIQRVIAFGDSLMDCGTFGHIYATNPGRTYPQEIAEAYGIELSPNRQVEGYGHDGSVDPDGLCYAEGGAVTGSFTEPGFDHNEAPLAFSQQVRNFEMQHGRFRQQDLILVQIGGNDIIGPFYDKKLKAALMADAPLPSDIREQVEARIRHTAMNEVKLLRYLLSLGAQRLVVLNNTDYGKAPYLEPWTEQLAARNHELVRLYNQTLQANLPASDRLLLVDAYSVMEEVFAHYGNYGFTHAEGDACLPGREFCDPDSYVEPGADQAYIFGARGHFASRTHSMLAQVVLERIAQTWPGSAAQDKSLLMTARLSTEPTYH